VVSYVLSLYLATCCTSLVGGVCACYVTLSGDLLYESCRRGVCVYVTLSGDLFYEYCRWGVCVLSGELLASLVGEVFACYVSLSTTLLCKLDVCMI